MIELQSQIFFIALPCSGDVCTLGLAAMSSNIFPGTQQMLLHDKIM